jgi:iron complex transport system permease protein
LLAWVGALLQALLRNPLADPGVLGVAGGASLGALLALWLGAGVVLTQAGAGLGALAAALALVGLSARSLSSPLTDTQASVRVLLGGVMIAAGCGALISLILSLAPESDLRGMLFWLLGDMSGARYTGVAWAAWLLAALSSVGLARPLNLVALGDVQALTLGVRVRLLRWKVLGAASLMTGIAVTVGGAIGFVGLVVPHVLRRWLGHDQRVLLPGCLLGGGSFLVLADTLARTAWAPLQLPVGVMTALIGVPVFLWVMYRARR